MSQVEFSDKNLTNPSLFPISLIWKEFIWCLQSPVSVHRSQAGADQKRQQFFCSFQMQTLKCFMLALLFTRSILNTETTKVTDETLPQL